ncbi:MAG: NAD(P)/FAD-dependent oxidoreductase [Anaerolineaceae bacterium]|nr:NAD(P)/FAD-dependent oxidoreductase [Anaerolineaceae bacterium]
MSPIDESYDLVVIGGGAAGFFAAINCAENYDGARILILEKGRQPLAKVRISGGGRCNVTHACFDTATLTQYYPRGSQELRGPFSRFQPADTLRWFEKHGVMLVAEADGRIFPASNTSQTIIDCFLGAAGRSNIAIRTQCAVETLQPAEKGFELGLRQGGRLFARFVLLASGGDPGSMQLAVSAGHSLAPPVPSLFTFHVQDPRLEGLSGLSVDPVEISLPAARLSQRGPLLVTHWGVSGPAVIRLSAWAARYLHEQNYRAKLTINWLPGERPEEISAALTAAKQHTPRQQVATHAPFPALPARLWRRLVQASGMGADLTWAEATRGQLHTLGEQLSCASFTLQGKSAFKEEFVTCGGVPLREVDLRTMHSRVCPGLFLAGEVLDIDGVTGGFNFQNAWTTAWLAAQEIALRLEKSSYFSAPPMPRDG